MNEDIITENLAKSQRQQRDLLLKNVDRLNSIWWESMTNDEKDSWREYRQKLLNVPEQEGFPHIVEWPIDPIRQSILDSEVPPDEVIAPE